MLAGRALGKAAPRHDRAGIAVTNTAFGGLPPAPAETNWLKPGDKFPMYGNDIAGDCTAAAQAIISLHESRISTKVPVIWSTDNCYTLYKATSGWDGVPGSATDTGAVIADVGAYMCVKGLDIGLQARETLSRSIGIDHTNAEMIAQAVALFGSCNLGWVLRMNMAESTNGRWIYDPNSPIDGGHDAAAVDIRMNGNQREFLIATWTELFWIDEESLRETADEAWLHFGIQHWMNVQGRSPQGYDLTTIFNYANVMAASFRGQL